MQVLNVLLEEKTLQTNCVRFASLTQKLPLWKPASALQSHSNPEVKGCRFCAHNTYLWTRIKISDNIWLFNKCRGVVDIQRLAIPRSWLEVAQLGKTPAFFDRPLCRQTGWSWARSRRQWRRNGKEPYWQHLLEIHHAKLLYLLLKVSFEFQF